MSGTIMLSCWVIHTPITQIFPVKVAHDEIWGAVKDAIKEKKKPEFDDIAAILSTCGRCVTALLATSLCSTPNSKGHHRSFPTFSLGIRRFLEERYSHKPT
jgi:hypothetical protein